MQYAQNQIAGAAVNHQAPKTIASAAANIDELNSRLMKAAESLSMISSQLGALTPVGGKSIGRDPSATEASGAVHRLNRSAEQAHLTLAEIEACIAGIGRALG